uniref:DNA fragmentation factor subunit alpha-like n=1 Tax=Myxine glutinosa TaxID=7769 RepID=UPI00358F0E98
MAVKPFKVSVLNEPSHGLVASSLKELTHLGCKKLHVTEKKQVQVVLAEDGTLVDDEEYFSFLEPNTALVFLMPNQTWQPSCSRTGPKTAEMTEVDTGAGEEPEWLGPAQRLSMYSANILLLSDIQLQAVLETKLSDLACVVNDNKQAEALQDGCQQLLDDRDRRRETLQLLKLMRDQNGKRIRHSYIPYRKTSCICNAGWFCPEEDIDRCEQCTPHTTCPVGKGVKQKETPKNEDQMDSCLVPHSNMDTSLEARLCMPQPHVGLSTEELQDVVKMDPADLINIPQKESVVNLCQEELKTRLMLVDTFIRSEADPEVVLTSVMKDIAVLSCRMRQKRP